MSVSLSLVPLAAEGQQQTGKVHRIGVLREGPGPDPLSRPFADAMREVGWVDGQNFKIERRNADRREQLPALAAELVRLQVDLILTTGTPATRPGSTVCCRRRCAHLLVTSRANGRFIWTWESGPPGWGRLLWPMVQSAAKVLTSDDVVRLKKSLSSNCAWVFLDTTRNGTRRWCDMKVCGNRAKALRYYARHRLTRTPRSVGRSSVGDRRST